MVYMGIETDIDVGNKFADDYEFLTNNGLATLKRFGNLLVSVDRFERGLLKAGKVKPNMEMERLFKTYHERVAEREVHKQLLADECERVVGFKVRFRLLPATQKDEFDTIIVERIQ